MIYTKIKTENSKEICINADELNYFCKCPRCGRETRFPLDLLDGEDMFECAVYCDQCEKILSKQRKNICDNIRIAVTRMAHTKLQQLNDIVTDFAKEELNEEDR